jgi:anti-sigma B factor antagonist
MRLEERLVGNVVIVSVTGEITLKKTNDGTLYEKARSLVQQGHRNVLVDLAGVSFVDSAGLGELVQTSSMMRNGGGSLKLVNATPRFRELLVLTRLTSVFGVYDDEAQAVASFGPSAS